jgi:hypothetical protein
MRSSAATAAATTAAALAEEEEVVGRSVGWPITKLKIDTHCSSF